MAAPGRSSRLGEVHRALQLKFQRNAVKDAAGLWKLLDVENLEGSSPAWLRAMGLAINAQRKSSANAAAGYVQALHALETGERLDASDLKLAGDINRTQLTKGLLFSGPGVIGRELKRGKSAQDASQFALEVTLGTASRYTANAGRDTMHGTTAKLPKVLGWARMTGPNPCAFCALLASRGPVYKSRTSATKTEGEQGLEQYHNNCSCWAVPIYSELDAWPGKAKEWEALYARATRGFSGDEKRNAFRRAYEKTRASRYN